MHNLFIKLRKNVVKFPHHLRVDGVSRSDVSEVEQHLEGTLGRPQRLERRVNEALGFNLNQRHLVVELFLHQLPLVAVLNDENVERRLNINANKIS